MKKSTYLIIGICFLIPSFILAGTNPARVSGTFVLDGKTYNIKNVVARTEENAFDESKKDVVLILTDQPAPENKQQAAAQAESGKLHGVIIHIDDRKQPYSMIVLGVAQKSGNMICEFEPTKFDTTAVEGKIYTKQPEESFGHKYEFNIQVSTSVKDTVVPVVDEKTGTPLPADGGEPGKAFLEYDRIIMKGDLAGLKKFIANEEHKKMLEDPKAKDMLEMMKVMRATNIKITKGFSSGDRATLLVEGKDPSSGEKVDGTIRLLRVNKQWMVEKETWKQ